MTMTEARQRLAFNRFNMRRSGVDFIIHPMEGNKNIKDYSSDDLEDVVLMSGRLRNRK